MKQYPWSDIQDDYVINNFTYDALKQKYGCSIGAVSKNAQAGRWDELRKVHQLEVAEQARKKLVKAKVTDRARFDEMIHTSADAAAAFSQSELVKHNNELVKMRRKEKFNKKRILSVRKVLDLLDVSQKALTLKYRALDIALPKQPIEFSKVKPPAEMTGDEIVSAMQEVKGDPEQADNGTSTTDNSSDSES